MVYRIANFLKGARVGIAGVGGLGSNCAVALARTGVGNLIIADFDKVDVTNLNRQYYFRDQIGMPKVEALRQNILRINDDLNIIAFDCCLTPENIGNVFADCSIIIEAFDKVDQKQMLAEFVLEQMPHATLIMASGLAGFKTRTLKTERFTNLIVCGDLETEVDENHPPMAPIVGIVALMQANETINILLKDFR